MNQAASLYLQLMRVSVETRQNATKEEGFLLEGGAGVGCLENMDTEGKTRRVSGGDGM